MTTAAVRELTNPVPTTPMGPAPVIPAAGSVWPKDASALILPRERAATTSGMARAQGWRLVFERRSPSTIEPLMGWTGNDDPLAQVELSFPTLEAAIRYAEREGLAYTVLPRPGEADRAREAVQVMARAFSEATLGRLGLGALKESYGGAMAGAAGRGDPAGEEEWASPMEVVADPGLALEAKRAILMNWAWTEHLLEQATGEGMPENGRASRLDEVERALLALEGRRPAEARRAA